MTLVSSQVPLSSRHIATAKALLQQNNFTIMCEDAWLAPYKAVDITIDRQGGGTLLKELHAHFYKDGIDIFVTSSKNRRKKLLIADMDSTIISGETLDDLAAYAGIKDKIAPITERAMRGELDFKEALRARVALLKGLPEHALTQTLAQTKLNQGAKTLIKTMKKNGALCVLVSGGFTFFTEAIGKQAGFDYFHGNLLQIENGFLAGSVADPILDKDSKTAFLQQYKTGKNLEADEVLALGDGANDLPMLQMAGLGMGYHPKPLLQQFLDNCILHGDLTAALYAQGYYEDELCYSI